MTPSFQAKEQLDFNFPLKANWPQPSTPHPNPAPATPRATIKVCAEFVFQGCVTWHAFVCEIYIFLKGRLVSEEWTSAVGVLRACTHIKKRIDWNILQKCLATSCSTNFQGRGGAEKCRLAFAAAKIEYEDVRVPIEEWPKEKSCK